MIKKLITKLFPSKSFVRLVYKDSRKHIINFIKKLHPYKTNLELIRMGSKGDGGYLIPDDLEGIEACFSPGVGDIIEFELDCISRDIKVFMADYSVNFSPTDIKKKKTNYNFQKKYIGCTNDKFLITMDKWVDDSGLGKDKDLILQMDIEGGEFLAIASMSDSLMKKFRIIVVEIHNLDMIWIKEIRSIFEAIFDKILKTHICVHIHPNNFKGEKSIDHRFDISIPKIAEFTFIRKDRIKNKTYEKNFPHKLDQDNFSEHKSVVLPKNWYRNS